MSLSGVYKHSQKTEDLGKFALKMKNFLEFTFTSPYIFVYTLIYSLHVNSHLTLQFKFHLVILIGNLTTNSVVPFPQHKNYFLRKYSAQMFSRIVSKVSMYVLVNCRVECIQYNLRRLCVVREMWREILETFNFSLQIFQNPLFAHSCNSR